MQHVATRKPAAIWTPNARWTAEHPVGDLITPRGRVVARNIYLEPARRLYPELDVRQAGT